MAIIEDELADIRIAFQVSVGRVRVGELTGIEDEDLIEEEDVLVL